MLAALVTGACSDGRDAARAQKLAALTSPPADSGVRLRAALARDTIAARDGDSVELIYALVNGPTAHSLDANPKRFEVYVTGPDGAIAKSLGGSGPPLSSDDRATTALHPFGHLILRQDLRCISIDGLYHPVSSHPTEADCLAMLALNEAGSYQIIVRYWPQRSQAELDSLAPLFRTQGLYIDREHPIGQYLADTVILTVAAR